MIFEQDLCLLGALLGQPAAIGPELLLNVKKAIVGRDMGGKKFFERKNNGKVSPPAMVNWRVSLKSGVQPDGYYWANKFNVNNFARLSCLEKLNDARNREKNANKKSFRTIETKKKFFLRT